jgi:hypothetical protein
MNLLEAAWAARIGQPDALLVGLVMLRCRGELCTIGSASVLDGAV